MSYMALLILTISAVAAVTVLVAAHEYTEQQQAASTGLAVQEADPKSMRASARETVDRALGDFRTGTAEAREDLLALGRDSLDRLNAQMEALEARAGELSEKTRENWERAKGRVEEARRSVARRMEALQADAGESLRDAREAIARALETLGERIVGAAEAVREESSESQGQTRIETGAKEA